MSTKIEWADEVWNPVTGCTKVSAGCKHCYAERIATRFRRQGIEMPHGNGCSTDDFSDILLHPDRLDHPLRWRKPRRVFVCSMGDLFHEGVPDGFIGSVITTAIQASRHQFLILTKRPRRMQRFFARVQADRNLGSAVLLPNWPIPNVWLGVSVEDQNTADERIPLLLQTPAALRFVSVEPMLGPVDIDVARYGESNFMRGLDWIICGGESGPGARPMHSDWARSIRDQCAAAGVPFFFKQWGEWAPAGKPRPIKAQGSTMIRQDGSTYQPSATTPAKYFDKAMIRVGKKAAGNLLDGVKHEEYPEVRA